MSRWKCAIGFVVLSLALSSAAVAADKLTYKMSTLTADTPSYLVMSAFADHANKALEGAVVEVFAEGVAPHHALDAARGKTDFYLSAPSAYFFMNRGDAMYSGITDARELSKNLRGILNFPAGVYHIVTLADSGIRSMKDIKGKKVFVGPASGAAKAIAINLVEGMSGLRAGIDFETVSTDWSAGAQALKNRDLDVYVNPANLPSPLIHDIAQSQPLRFFGLAPEDYKSQAFIQQMKLPGRTLESFDPKIYGNNVSNTKPIQSVGSWIGIGTHKQMSENDIYVMTRAFWENIADVQSLAPWLASMMVEDALIGMNMPLHPGAVKYYQEKGLVIPSDLIAKE